MAGEVLLINPRRRRGRRRKARRARVSKRRTHRRRRLVAHNPRRRRRAVGRRSHARRGRRRVHRNPRLPLLGSVNLGSIAAGTAGYVGTRYGTGFLLGVLPKKWTSVADGATQSTVDLSRIGAKAVVGLFALPFLAKMLPGGKGSASAIRTGAGIAIGVDIFETYLAKLIPLPMSDYEQGYITSYEQGQITGVDETGNLVTDMDAYGGGAYGGA